MFDPHLTPHYTFKVCYSRRRRKSKDFLLSSVFLFTPTFRYPRQNSRGGGALRVSEERGELQPICHVRVISTAALGGIKHEKDKFDGQKRQAGKIAGGMKIRANRDKRTAAPEGRILCAVKGSTLFYSTTSCHIHGGEHGVDAKPKPSTLWPTGPIRLLHPLTCLGFVRLSLLVALILLEKGKNNRGNVSQSSLISAPGGFLTRAVVIKYTRGGPGELGTTLDNRLMAL